MSERVIDNFDVTLVANRVHEMRLIRLNELPAAQQVRYRVTANITTQATLAIAGAAPNAISVIAKLVLEARFSEESGAGIEGNQFAEVQLSVDGVLLTSLQSADIADDPRIGPSSLSSITKGLITIAEVHLRQILSMAALPFAIAPEKLQEISRQQIVVATPAAVLA